MACELSLTSATKARQALQERLLREQQQRHQQELLRQRQVRPLQEHQPQERPLQVPELALALQEQAWSLPWKESPSCRCLLASARRQQR